MSPWYWNRLSLTYHVDVDVNLRLCVVQITQSHRGALHEQFARLVVSRKRAIRLEDPCDIARKDPPSTAQGADLLIYTRESDGRAGFRHTYAFTSVKRMSTTM